MLPVDLGGAVCLQFDVGGRAGGLICLWWVFGLMVCPLDPVASKLGQQDEWKRAPATQNLSVMDNNNVEKNIYNCWCVELSSAFLLLLQKMCALPI